MLLLSDREIIKEAESGMITPFEYELVSSFNGLKCLSYGLSSYGYDMRLSPKEFKVFRHVPGLIINPKNFNSQCLEDQKIQEDEYGRFFILPGNSYGLGVSLEIFNIPENVTAICLGKSTNARCGLHVNVTPLEAGWSGEVTIEISNSSSADCRVYAEGIAQLLFIKSKTCLTPYSKRKGKYQNQTGITLPKA